MFARACYKHMHIAYGYGYGYDMHPYACICPLPSVLQYILCICLESHNVCTIWYDDTWHETCMSRNSDKGKEKRRREKTTTNNRKRQQNRKKNRNKKEKERKKQRKRAQQKEKQIQEAGSKDKKKKDRNNTSILSKLHATFMLITSHALLFLTCVDVTHAVLMLSLPWHQHGQSITRNEQHTATHTSKHSQQH